MSGCQRSESFRMRRSARNDNSLIVRFFDKVIRDYNCGDVKRLLRRESLTLGPLLACVAAGIDAVGGMLFGFGRRNSRHRSVRFLNEMMKVDCATAEAIYCFARCGYVHEGIGKLALSWFAGYSGGTAGYVMYRRADGGLALDIAELARRYLRAVDVVSKNQRHRLRHLPKGSEDEVSLIRRLSGARKLSRA